MLSCLEHNKANKYVRTQDEHPKNLFWRPSRDRDWHGLDTSLALTTSPNHPARHPGRWAVAEATEEKLVQHVRFTHFSYPHARMVADRVCILSYPPHPPTRSVKGTKGKGSTSMSHLRPLTNFFPQQMTQVQLPKK